MEDLAKRFTDKKIFEQKRQVIADDYRFNTKKYSSLEHLSLSHQQPVFLESLTALGHRFIFTGKDRTCSSLHIEIMFCREAKDASSVLFHLAGGFQREIPKEVSRLDTEHSVGDFGLSWSWDAGTKAAFFMRNNVVVGLYGTCVGDHLIQIAKEIDDSLEKHKTISKYTEEKGIFFARMKERKVKATERLDIGTSPYKNETLFFHTTEGSVNRDIAKPDYWYYRAGEKKGSQTITLFHLAEGEVPKMERTTIEVT